MRIINLECKNFCSYPELSMNFENAGLALIQGKTGVGKSTIMDAICWALYGVTAKGTPADGVRPLTGGSETAAGIILEGAKGYFSIVRIRGNGKNDLFISSPDQPSWVVRGKDITETQQIINDYIGVDADTFIAGSYFHEFSPTGAFFTAKAKERRELFEQLADLDLPNKLAEVMAAKKKKSKADIEKQELAQERGNGKADQLQAMHLSTIRSVANWEKEKAKSILDLEGRYKNFDLTKQDALNKYDAHLVSLGEQIHLQGTILDAANAEKSPAVCETCGQGIEASKKYSAVQEALKYQSLNNLYERVSDNRDSMAEEENKYAPQIAKEKARVNPFHAEQEKVAADIVAHADVMRSLKKTLKIYYEGYAHYNALYDIAGVLRGELLKKAVAEVQEATNGYLEKYFDAELRIGFTMDSDSLEVTVLKNGYECAYKQLSKGQRGLLKLCFSVSVQEAVSNNKGISFSNLFYDESLDGYDPDLKLKAFPLFQKLAQSHESVMVIEHDTAFKNCFDKSFLVTMQGDQSVIQES